MSKLNICCITWISNSGSEEVVCICADKQYKQCSVIVVTHMLYKYVISADWISHFDTLGNSRFSWSSAENYTVSRNLAENWNSRQNPANPTISHIFVSAGCSFFKIWLGSLLPEGHALLIHAYQVSSTSITAFVSYLADRRTHTHRQTDRQTHRVIILILFCVYTQASTDVAPFKRIAVVNHGNFAARLAQSSIKIARERYAEKTLWLGRHQSPPVQHVLSLWRSIAGPP